MWRPRWSSRRHNTHSLWCRKRGLLTIASVDDLRTKFGRRVRELRQELKLSQEELAHRAGMHWTYLGGIERGERNPALVNVGRLASALGVSLADLFAPFQEVVRQKKQRP
jgi:ribosome-binding protein aMBF1 (putative translation factor)